MTTPHEFRLRPFHDRAVTLAMLTAFSGPPVAHTARGGYVCEPCYAKRAEPRRIRANSERDVLPPVTPTPAASWRAAKVFAGIVDGAPVVPPWRGQCRVHRLAFTR